MSDRYPRLTAKEAEKALFDAGFELLRQRGSHRIYGNGAKRMILPHHPGKALHPKIVKELKEIIQAEPE
jgi:predicted RNA binding protein YcfA (HicA-like mRNA interferase family)